MGMWAGARVSLSLQSLSANSHLCATIRLVCVLHTLVRGVYTLHHVCSRYGNVVVYNVRVRDGGYSGQYSLGCLVYGRVGAVVLFLPLHHPCTLPDTLPQPQTRTCGCPWRARMVYTRCFRCELVL